MIVFHQLECLVRTQLAKAVDIHVSNSQHRKQLIDYFTNKVSGLGIAKTFIHIDIISSDELAHRPNAWIY